MGPCLLLLPGSLRVAPKALGGIWLRWQLRGVTCSPGDGAGPPTWPARQRGQRLSQHGNQLLQHTPDSPHSLSRTSLPGHKRTQCSRGGLAGSCSLHKHPSSKGVSVSHAADGSSSSSSTGLPPSQPGDLHCCFPPPGKSQELSVPLSTSWQSFSPSLNHQPKNLLLQTYHCYLFYYPAPHNLYFFFYYLN